MIAAAVGGVLVWAAPRAGAATVAWTGTGGSSWATTTSWSPNGTGPGTGDIASFTDTGSTAFAGDVTSIVNATRTIAGLTVKNTAGKSHTLDLNAKTLTVNGNLHFNTDQSTLTTTTIRSGILALTGSSSTVNVGRASSSSGKAIADWSGLTSLSASILDFNIGVATVGTADGTLTLSASNTITATHVYVGTSAGASDSTGVLHLGAANTLQVSELTAGKDNASGTVDIATGGNLALGSAAARTLVQLGTETINYDEDFTGKLDLSAGTFTGYLSSVTVGQKQGDGFGSAIGIFNGGTGGSVNIGAAGNTANFYVGRKLTGGNDSSAVGSVDFSGLATLNASLANFTIGTSTTGWANGDVKLAASNTISATSIIVGSGTTTFNDKATNNSLVLGRISNDIQTPALTIGQNYASGSVTVAEGASVILGSASQRTTLTIGVGNTNHNDNFIGKLDLTGASLTANLGTVTVGQKDGDGFGDSVGTFAAGNSGSVAIGAVGSPANFYVGRKLSGGSDAGAVGSVDFSGLSTLTATLTNFTIGTATTGWASGNVKLPASNTISASSIIVGSGTTTFNDGAPVSTLQLGRTANDIQTPSLIIGQNYASGAVSVTPGASVTLGSTAQRTSLTIGVGTTNSNEVFTGSLDLSGTSFTGYLGSVTVGQRDGGAYSQAVGVLIAGNSGSIDIGAAGNTANFYVGRRLTGGNDGSAVGNVDFSGLSTLTASLNSFTIGTATTGWGHGDVKLAASNTISATSIVVGSGSTTFNDGAEVNTLVLGRTSNSIQTPSLTIGQNYASGSVTITPGASVSLGTAGQRTGLSIGVGNTETNSAFTGTLDLTGASLTAYLGSVTVGQKDGGGFGDAIGILIAGNSGSVDIGAAGNTANLYVSRKLTGGSDGSATGNADFSGLTTLTANLNTLSVGTALSGSSSGTLKLANTNTINALTMIVGSSGGGNNLLALGQSNTILTNQITLALDTSSASVTIPAGGSLTLGSAAQRTAITMGTGDAFGSFSTATFDISNARLTAYLGNVVVGGKNASTSGTKIGTFTISNRADNYVDANAITLADGVGSTGTLNFGGGALIANSITSGGGTANFNWLGGRLSVGSFGTSTINFALKNTGTGTLSPGATAGVVATTTVFGAYQQSSLASLAIDIAGTSPGAGNDLVAISGAATLAGNLNLSLVGGFVPSVGQSFVIGTYASRTGTFAYVAPPALPADVALQVDYSSATQLVLRAVTPAAADYVSSASAGSFATAGSWNTGTTPGTTTVATINHSDPAAQTVSVNANTTVHAVWLQSTGGTLTLDVPAGIKLAAANQIVVGPKSLLRVDGSVADSGGVTVNNGGKYQATSTQSVRALTVNDGGAAEVTGATLRVLTTQALTMNGTTANLDLHKHAMVVDYSGASPITASGPTGIRAAIASAYHGGDWAGKGIGSTEVKNSIANGPLLAIGYGEVSALIGGNGGAFNFGSGVTANVDGTAVIMRTTLSGDADLDGAVNLNDLIRLANNYGTSSGAAVWTMGDFDYDGKVDLNDLIRLANNYGGALGADTVAGDVNFMADVEKAFSAVPEPGSVGLIAGLVGVGLMRRRRRVKECLS